jgi:hypothetical protein
LRVQRDQQMYVIGRAAGGDQSTIVIADDPAEVFVESVAGWCLDLWCSVLGAEDDVVAKASI